MGILRVEVGGFRHGNLSFLNYDPIRGEFPLTKGIPFRYHEGMKAALMKLPYMHQVLADEPPGEEE